MGNTHPVFAHRLPGGGRAARCLRGSTTPGRVVGYRLPIDRKGVECDRTKRECIWGGNAKGEGEGRPGVILPRGTLTGVE